MNQALSCAFSRPEDRKRRGKKQTRTVGLFHLFFFNLFLYFLIYLSKDEEAFRKLRRSPFSFFLIGSRCVTREKERGDGSGMVRLLVAREEFLDALVSRNLKKHDEKNITGSRELEDHMK